MANKQKILIVDDDENIAELISLYMTKECFETKIVYDGESALLEANSFAPDLILLDLMLPGIDGYQVCREVRQKSQTPIIMLSAKGKSLTRYSVSSSGLTITLRNRLTPRSLWRASRQSCAAIRLLPPRSLPRTPNRSLIRT